MSNQKLEALSPQKNGKIDIREHVIASTPLFLPSKISMSNRGERHVSHELHYYVVSVIREICP